jgi:predicted DNA-binding transcriptional regulator AlpA
MGNESFEGKSLLMWSDLRSDGLIYSRAHLYRLIKAGLFPAPVHIGPNRVAFIAHEYEAWKAHRMAERATTVSRHASKVGRDSAKPR